MTLRAVSTLALTSLLALATGCAAVGNVIFTPHPASLSDVDPTLDLVPCVGAQAVPAAAAGVALAALQAFLKSEAARYRASYSAAASKEVGNTCFRFVGDGLVSFKGKIATSATASRVVNGTFKPEATKSKVASWPVRTWTTGQNPFAGQGWGAGPAHRLRHHQPHHVGPRAVGMGRRRPLQGGLRRSHQDRDRRSRRPQSEVGRERDPDRQVLHRRDRRRHRLEVGPGERLHPEARPLEALPTNVTITIVEANDLGDVIGKGAELVEDKSFADKVKGFFGN